MPTAVESSPTPPPPVASVTLPRRPDAAKSGGLGPITPAGLRRVLSVGARVRGEGGAVERMVASRSFSAEFLEALPSVAAVEAAAAGPEGVDGASVTLPAQPSGIGAVSPSLNRKSKAAVSFLWDAFRQTVSDQPTAASVMTDSATTSGTEARAPSILSPSINAASAVNEQGGKRVSPSTLPEAFDSREREALSELGDLSPGTLSTSSPHSVSSSSSQQTRSSVVDQSGDAVAGAAVAYLSQSGDERTPLASKRRNSDFHELFPDLPLNDLLVEDYSCAWQKEVLIQGRMYISQHNISFSSNILGWVTVVSIPLLDILSIEKKNVAGIIPNSIQLIAKNKSFFFASFLQRDATFALLYTLWEATVSKAIQLKPISRPDHCVCTEDESCARCTIALGQPKLPVDEEVIKSKARRSMSLSFVDTESQERKADEMGVFSDSELETASRREKGRMSDEVPEGPARGEAPKEDGDKTGLPPTDEPSDTSQHRADDKEEQDELKPQSPPSQDILDDSEPIEIVRKVSNQHSSASISPSASDVSPDLAVESTQRPLPPPKSHSHHKQQIHSHIPTHPHVHIPHRAYRDSSPSPSRTIAAKVAKPSSIRQRHRRRKQRPARPAFAAIATCPCGDMHEKMTPILDAVFPCSVPRLWTMMFEYTSTREGVLRKFLEGKRKCRDFKIADWSAAGADVDDPTDAPHKSETVSYAMVAVYSKRKLEYVNPLSNPLGPKETRCKIVESIAHKSNQSYICISQITETPDVPSGTSFHALARVCLTTAADGCTRLRVSCSVEWTKSSWLKSAINTAVPGGLKSYHVELEAALREYLVLHPDVQQGAATTDHQAGNEGSGSDGEYMEDEEDLEGDAALGEAEDISSNVLRPHHHRAHPLAAELAELERTDRETSLRHRTQQNQTAQQRKLLFPSHHAKPEPPDIAFRTPTEGTILRPFIPSRRTQQAPVPFGSKAFWKAAVTVQRSIFGSWMGLALLALLIVLSIVVSFGLLRWVIKREVEHALALLLADRRLGV
ncbi:hypothetical protein DFS34DRAFT_274427 [Phlyctochytrium arcticum]|nr:hypothetical protein DFS34DRAFT_274427 [Phlyctochytrium arcticum]